MERNQKASQVSLYHATQLFSWKIVTDSLALRGSASDGNSFYRLLVCINSVRMYYALCQLLPNW